MDILVFANVHALKYNGQEQKMKYHNGGVLRNEQDSTLLLKPYSQRRKLTWVEYVPLVVLGILVVSLLMKGIVG